MQHFYSITTPEGTEHIPLSSSTQLLVDTAIELGLTVEILHDTKVIKLTDKNGNDEYFQAQTPGSTSYMGFYCSEDKGTSRALLMKSGLSVPKGYVIRAQMPHETRKSIFAALAKPLVIKPVDGTHGDQVYVGVSDVSKYIAAVSKCIAACRGEWPGAVVEEQFIGAEYRILCTRKQVLGIVQRIPANVIGDGVSTIKQLLHHKNSDPKRSDHPDAPIQKIRIDQQVVTFLAHKGLSLESIPDSGDRVFLRGNSNISTGGDSIDFTDKVHDSVKELAIKAINAIPGLRFAGIDFMSKDIAAPQDKNSYCIIELNKSPGFDIHTFPFEGTSRPVAALLLREIFPSIA